MICRDWVVGCVSGSMGVSGEITNNLINLDIIWRFIICRDTPTHGWVHGLLDGWVGQWVNGWVRWNHLKLNKSWPNWDNSILFEELWFIETPWPMGGWLGGSVGQWVRSGQMTKNLINLDLIEIIQFCLKIYDLLRHPHLWVGVWVDGWVNGWGQVKWLI